MVIVGIDPGSYSIGVAVTNGYRFETRTVSAKGESLLARLAILHAGLVELFDKIKDPDVSIAVEDGIYKSFGRNVIRTAIMLAEVRGLVLAEAFRRKWPVRRVAVATWKSRLGDTERKMKKDGAYVRHFNATRGWSCVSPDEVDAILITGVGA